MKFSSLSLLALSAGLVHSRFVEKHETDNIVLNGDSGIAQERYLIELAPGELRWVSEEEKWELRRVCPRPITIPTHVIC